MIEEEARYEIGVFRMRFQIEKKGFGFEN